MQLQKSLALLFFILANLPALAEEPLKFPPSEKKPVVTEYHGEKVSEDYRWLEDAASPETKTWVDAQNKFSRAYLDSLSTLKPIQDRLKFLNSKTSPAHYNLIFRDGILFAMKSQPPKNQPMLVRLKSADNKASEKMILDPNKLNAKGTTAIDFFSPSLDAKLVAVSLSDGGSEDGTVHVYETNTGRELKDVIPRVNGGTAGGAVAWNKDGTGFFYTRYPRGTERPKEDMDFYQQVYFHKLGTSTDADTYAVGKDFPRIAETQIFTSPNRKYTMAAVANGDGGEYAHYLLGPSGEWQQITKFSDQIRTVEFGRDDTLYLLSRSGAPRGKILRLALTNGPVSLDQAKLIIPEGEMTIEGITATATRLYIDDLVGGPSDIRVFDLNGKPLPEVTIPAISSVNQIVGLDGDAILFQSESFVSPPAWFSFKPGMAKAKRTALYRTSAADFSDYDVAREFAVSKDGTKVPVSIIKPKKLKLDGHAPTVLSAYGGYGISLSPRFRVNLKAWLEQGGVYAIANIRGGGEYGEAWHLAGNLAHKQNVFDDFAAAAQHLIARKYTSTPHLAIEGGSNGGLLMGAALTQHPDLYRAVVSHVGIYDMLRVELHPNGAFNVTEFGTVKDPTLFKAMYAYSPYHRVVDKTAYPAVMFLTGDNDPRVDPANSRKMTARLQAATSSNHPILLRTTANAGHGGGTPLSERIAKESDVYAYLFDQLGVTYKVISGKK